MKSEIRQQAIRILRHVDFGHRVEEELARLEEAVDLLNQHGYRDPDLDAAIRYFKSDPERARQHLYGPTPNGDGEGAVNRLMAPDTLVYRGAVYRCAALWPPEGHPPVKSTDPTNKKPPVAMVNAAKAFIKFWVKEAKAKTEEELDDAVDTALFEWNHWTGRAFNEALDALKLSSDTEE